MALYQTLRELLSKPIIIQEAISLDEYAPEPKRAALNLDTLGLTQNGGVANIMAVYNQATPEEKDYWGRWYHHANKDVAELADKYRLDFRMAAGVVAVLSPGNKWLENLKAAEKVIEGVLKVNAYPAFVKKAQNILQGAPVEQQVTGPKVSVFLQSLINPDAVEKDIVLDGHAINIWRGTKRALKNLAKPTVQERRQMVEDYSEAAKQLGVPTQAVQAVTWYIWKYSKHDPAQGLQVSPGQSQGVASE